MAVVCSLFGKSGGTGDWRGLFSTGELEVTGISMKLRWTAMCCRGACWGVACLLSGVLTCGAAEMATSSAVEYRVGPRDLLEVKVLEAEELNTQGRVTESGKLKLRIAGDVEVAGMTRAECEVRIKEILEASYIQRATVQVQVLEYRSNPIRVMGAVKNPGEYGVPGRLMLLEALELAGGLSGKQGKYVYVSRRANNGLSDRLRIALDDLLGRPDREVNIPVFPNDVIKVPIPMNVTIYCIGEFRKPGLVTFKSDERVSLLKLVARVGGFSDKASNKVLIRRRTHRGKEIEIKVNYKRIVAGKEPDVELKPDDIVVVKESFF